MTGQVYEKFMLLAIAKAKQGISSGQTPFGACITKHHKVISCAHNQVWEHKDITAHAEIIAIRKACQKLKTIDLSGAILYSTCEPCPMCFAACHWAKIPMIVYGAGINDAKRAGFNELKISNQTLKRAGRIKIKVIKGILKEDNLKLFKLWQSLDNKRLY